MPRWLVYRLWLRSARRALTRKQRILHLRLQVILSARDLLMCLESAPNWRTSYFALKFREKTLSLVQLLLRLSLALLPRERARLPRKPV